MCSPRMDKLLSCVPWLVVLAALSGLLLLASARTSAQNPPPDLPGFGHTTDKTRVLVVLDTSMSMAYTPTYSASDPSQDYDSSPCTTKFCIAKQTLYDVLADTHRLEVGIGGYYQTLKSIHVDELPARWSVKCEYDVIAKDNQAIHSSYAANMIWRSRVELDADRPSQDFPCDPTEVAVESASSRMTGPQPCESGVRRTCRRYSSGLSPTTNLFSNPGCRGEKKVPYPNANSVCEPPTTWFNSSVNKWYRYSTSGWNGTILYQDPDPNGKCEPMILGVTSGNSCSASNPCDWFLWSTTGETGSDVVAQDISHNYIFHQIEGPLKIGTRTYDSYRGLNPATPSKARIEWPQGERCPVNPHNKGSPPFISGYAPYNCASTPDGYGCDLVGGGGFPQSMQDQAADTKTAYNESMNVAGYSRNGVAPTVSTFEYTVPYAYSCHHAPGEWFDVTTSTYNPPNRIGGGVSLGCSSSYTSFPGPCRLQQLDDIPRSDSGTRICRFKRFSYQYTRPGTVKWYCEYSVPRYQWTETRNRCRYRRRYYRYGEPYWDYYFRTREGDLVDRVTYTSTAAPDHDLCTNGEVGPSICPETITSVSPCGNSWVKECRLRWNGRYANTKPYTTATRTLCQAAGPTPLDRQIYRSDWCSTSLVTASQPAYDIPPYPVADYYDPSVSNSGMYTGIPSGRTGTVTFDPPLHAYKDLGLSYYTHGAHQGRMALSFVPIAEGTTRRAVNNPPNEFGEREDGDVLKALQRYHPDTNPLGLRLPVEGMYTPLYGVMVGVRQYLQSVIDADPSVACRPYYVLLVTDGEEDPILHTDEELAASVAALRNLKAASGAEVDVRTFVVGFGSDLAGSNVLNLMARAGGYALDENGMRHESCLTGTCTAGTAYNAADRETLSAQLQQIFGAMVTGAYSRSKPVINKTGARVYLGYFEHPGWEKGVNPNTQEWRGHLDAWDLSGESVPDAPLWRLSQRLNTPTTDGFRVVYTLPTGEGALRRFEESAHNPDGAATYCQLAKDLTLSPVCDDAAIADADATIRFVRNDRGPRAHFEFGAEKSSRLSDIFHSVPVIVEAPSFSLGWALNSAEANAYAAFRNAQAARGTRIYIGSNTGMLHAVREDLSATTATSEMGTEAWAYVPNSVLRRLRQSRFGHEYLVDGSMAVTDVCFGNGCEAEDGSGWKTVLIGTLGRGGNGIFALDVTDADAPSLLWDKQNLQGFGETWSPPSIGRVEVGESFKWGAFIGGGVSLEPGEGNTFQVLDVQTGDVLVGADPVLDVARFTVPQVRFKPEVPARARLFRPGDASRVTVVYFTDTEAKLNRMDVRSKLIRHWAPVTMFDPFTASPGCPATAVEPLPDSVSVTATNLPLSAPTPPYSYPRMLNRPYLGEDDAPDSSGRRILYVATGDVADPEALLVREYIFAVRDDYDAVPTPTCKAPVLWAKALDPSWKVLSDPAILGQNIVFAVFKPHTGDDVCGNPGASTLYCFHKVTGEPSPCLYPPATEGDPDPAAVTHLDLGSVGIVSDLTVVNDQLVYNTSVNPSRPQVLFLEPPGGAFTVDSMRRIQ